MMREGTTSPSDRGSAMKRFIAASAFALLLTPLADAQYGQQQQSEGPVPLPAVPAVPPVPALPPLPGGTLGNGWQGNPYYRYEYNYTQWRLRNPYTPQYYYYYTPEYYANPYPSYGQ